MKYPIGILTIVTLFVALVLSGCDGQSNRMDNAETSVVEGNRDLEITNDEVEAELREYRIENADRMTEYDRTIEEIREEIDNETDNEVKVGHETRLQEYEVKKRELNREMDNYRVSGRENWNSFKESFSSRMDDLGDSLNDFFSTGNTPATSRN